MKHNTPLQNKPPKTMFGRILFIALIGMASIFSSCNNEVPVNAEWQDIAYVYGILNPIADTQFVRIGKAFLGDGPPSEFAQIPDSIYYQNINVSMEELSGERVDRSFSLERINRPGQLQPGFFTTEEFHLYYTTEQLDTSKTYRLVIEKPDGGPTVSAETRLTFWRRNLNTGNVIEPFTDRLAFINTFGESNRVTFAWEKAFNSGAHEGRLIFRYKEQNRSNKSDIKTKTIVYTVPGAERNNRITVEISDANFYGFIASNIQPDPNVFRYFDTIFFEAIAGANDMRLYAEINRPSSGITQERPSFTNVENGVGLFSSMTETTALTNGRVKRFMLNPNSYNALVMDLCDLNFVKLSFTDSCYCDGGVIQRIGNTTSNCNIN